MCHLGTIATGRSAGPTSGMGMSHSKELLSSESEQPPDSSSDPDCHADNKSCCSSKSITPSFHSEVGHSNSLFGPKECPVNTAHPQVLSLLWEAASSPSPAAAPASASKSKLHGTSGATAGSSVAAGGKGVTGAPAGVALAGVIIPERDLSGWKV